MTVFRDCVECGGAKGCPRNGRGGRTCSSNECKDNYRKKRKDVDSAPTVGLGDAEPQATFEMMPSGKWIQDLEEILGERCCQLRQLSQKKRKNGPGSMYNQQFLVRGKFLEEDGDEDDSDADDCPEWNTYWMDAVDLLATIAKTDVKAALVARHARVIEEL